MQENDSTNLQEDTVLTTPYIVGPDPQKNIFLTIEIGESGQNGESLVTVLGKETTYSGTVHHILLGNAGQLHKERVLVITNIQDMPENENLTKLIITLKGGVRDLSYTLSKYVEEGGNTTFVARISIFKLNGTNQ
jgi:hypothetical protein